MVRACVGLSYPATVSSTGGRRLETITKDAPLNLVHGDLHGENVMIGKHNDQLAFPEHALLPPMKLIDLGEASDGGPRAASENINKVSMVRGDFRSHQPRNTYGTDCFGVEASQSYSKTPSGQT